MLALFSFADDRWKNAALRTVPISWMEGEAVESLLPQHWLLAQVSVVLDLQLDFQQRLKGRLHEDR